MPAVGASASAAAEPPAQEKDDESWKKLAEAAEALEKAHGEDEDVKEIKKQIGYIRDFLEKADRMDVFELDPRKVDETKTPPEPTFHGYRVLGHVHVEKAERRKELAVFLGKSFHWSRQLEALCFNPRHGLRAVHGEETMELVICFQCNRIDVYLGEKHWRDVAVLARNHEIFDQILGGGAKEPEEKSKP